MRLEIGDSEDWSISGRRRALLAAGVSVAGTLAGCSGLGESPTEQPFAALDRQRVYLDDGVDLSAPDAVPTGSEPSDAGVVVVPGDTERSPNRAAEWIADRRTVALLGDGCGDTWNSWVMTSAFATDFDVMGAEWGQPDADLVVGTAIGLNLVTYGRTWEGMPSDTEIMQELDSIASDIEGRRGGD
ncbi:MULTISPECIES: hypothetical protein [Halolamina]|uniref:Uncharacterized protein n=1 Tax=Halolamina pelagica TaxID=699431 RepID=A0A1I5NSI7_9EURY|nr:MULTISPECIES: hypothetical protein [Halolamina]NHX36457.1 hypothetical protein [Halolamina sp. R1-12]SFP24754.1 hypothetical protein SAMN05216277_102174 [Halolamina pelagica]